MEFRDDKIARETQYFGDSFVAPRMARSMGRTDGHITLEAREFANDIAVGGLQAKDGKIHIRAR